MCTDDGADGGELQMEAAAGSRRSEGICNFTLMQLKLPRCWPRGVETGGV